MIGIKYDWMPDLCPMFLGGFIPLTTNLYPIPGPMVEMIYGKTNHPICAICRGCQ